jgi:hypothetical protein
VTVKAKGRRLEAIGALSAVVELEDGTRAVEAVGPGDRVATDHPLVELYPDNFRYPKAKAK